MSLEKGFKRFIKSPFSFLASPLSWLFFLILVIKKWCTKAGLEIPGVYVVSIGNLDFGGTGKTPTLLAFLRDLQGPYVAVITRGYRSVLEHKGSTKVNHLAHSLDLATIIGDEPALILSKFPEIPLYVGKKRSDGLRKAADSSCRVVLLDDGAQHTSVKKHLNVLVLDKLEPIKPLFPCGYRRDSLECLKKADLLIFSYVDSIQEYHDAISKIRPYTNAPCVGLQATLELETQGKNIALLTAIANPQRLAHQLIKRGYTIKTQLILDDHAYFSKNLLDKFLKEAQGLSLVCTEKDLVKIPSPYKKLFNAIKLTLKPTFDLETWERFIGKIKKMS